MSLPRHLSTALQLKVYFMFQLAIQLVYNVHNYILFADI